VGPAEGRGRKKEGRETKNSEFRVKFLASRVDDIEEKSKTGEVIREEKGKVKQEGYRGRGKMPAVSKAFVCAPPLGHEQGGRRM